MNFPTGSLKEWFAENRRELPWREDPSPYRVWISEVMLQQTQVSVVIPYFERWMKLFPTVESLARASQEQVIKAWEGLGYYSRARYLHEAAQVFLNEYGGVIPSNPEALSKIKGLGPYTIGAILNFAFHQKIPAVDGNVIRVLSRYFAILEEVDNCKMVKKITQKVEDILPENAPWIISEALIELGALVCKKQEPLCLECPLRPSCLAFRHGLQSELPKKKKKTSTTVLYRLVAVIDCQGWILLKKGEKGKVMSDLYEFPYVEIKAPFERGSCKEEAAVLFSKELGRKLIPTRSFPKQEHGFTRYRAHLFPFLLTTAVKNENECWKTREELASLPFSSGHRRILNLFLETP